MIAVDSTRRREQEPSISKTFVRQSDQFSCLVTSCMFEHLSAVGNKILMCDLHKGCKKIIIVDVI